MSSAVLTERFNHSLANKLLTFIDEATWRGNKSEDAILKRYTGSPTISVEEKYGARYDIENYSRYGVASNNEEAIAMEVGQRRYVILEADNRYANDKQFWRPKVEAIKENDIEIRRFLNYLLKKDLTNFDPHKLLLTTDGEGAKIATSGPVAKFWYDTIFELHQPYIYTQDLDGSWFLLKQETYTTFLDYCDRIRTYQREYTHQKFWHETCKLFRINNQKNTERIKIGEERTRALRIVPSEVVHNFISVLAIKRPDQSCLDDMIKKERPQYDNGAWLE